MKLGRLLLRGLNRRRAGPRPRFGFSGKKKKARARAKTKARLVREKEIETPAPAQPLVPVPQVQPRPAARPEPQALATVDLVRPSDKLRQSIEAFLLDQRSPHTRRAYGKDLKRFVRFLIARGVERGIETLDRHVIIAYKESLIADGRQHTTVDRHLATLRSFFGWLVDDGILSRSPADGVRFLNPKRLSRTIGFTDEEVRSLLEKPNLHTRTGSLHYAILMTLFYCGLRRSEVCALRTVNLGTERGHRVLRLMGKGNAERVLPLQAAVWHAILYYLRISRREEELAKDVPLFVAVKSRLKEGAAARPLDGSMIFYIVRKYAKAASIQNRVSPHSCRATAISNARDRNVPDRAIQEFAGWASPDMITRYDKRKTAVEGSAALAIRYGTPAEEKHRDEKTDGT